MNPNRIMSMLKENQVFEINVDDEFYTGTFVNAIYGVMATNDGAVDRIKIFLKLK
jgi:hypothetical protein